jgi:adenine-specific DNA-methyltransferase
VITFNEHQTAVYADFTVQPITSKFRTIIGNPPYIKQKTGNLYIQFIELCYNLLEADGELIFIVPSDFIKLTSASALLETMTQNGSFTDFLFPHDEKLFEGASIDVLVFRYEKGLRSNRSSVNGTDKICNVTQGIITFSDSEIIGKPLSDSFSVYVGLVSGRDEIYRTPFGNIEVLSDKDKREKFIFAETFPTADPAINAHLLAHKGALLERKIKKFSEANWFEWGAPRNIKSIRAESGKPCIYVRNITRNKEVAFLGKVEFFGGGLLCLVPKTTGTDLKKIVDLLNTEAFQKDYLYAGRFKMGHKQVSNVILPTS